MLDIERLPKILFPTFLTEFQFGLLIGYFLQGAQYLRATHSFPSSLCS